MAWLYFSLFFTFKVNPCTAAISATSPFSIGVSLTAFQYSPSMKTLPPRESIGVNAVAVFLTIEGELRGFVNSRNALQIGSRRRVAEHCMSDVRVPAFIPESQSPLFIPRLYLGTCYYCT